MYHGITDRDINCWTQLPEAVFKTQMRYISDHHRPKSLSDAAEILSGHILSPKYVIVVTFDDGFANNVSIAYPILEKYSIPATIFLTTSFIDKDPKFAGLLWTDYILALFRSTDLKQIDLSDLGLEIFNLDSLEKRHQAKDIVCGMLKKLNFEEKNRIVEKIGSRLGGKISARDQEIFRSLSWEDVSALSKEGFIDFGAHTVSHEILSRMPKETAEREIIDSKRYIEIKSGRSVKYFAYPNGRRADFNNETKAIVAEYFECALTTIEGLNSAGDDMYELKRVNIGNDLSMIEFKLLISGTIDFIRRIIPGGHNS